MESVEERVAAMEKMSMNRRTSIDPFPPVPLLGAAMLAATLIVPGAFGQTASSPSLRTLRYVSRPREQAVAWQKQVRSELAQSMKIEDLLNRREPLPLKRTTLSKGSAPGHLKHEIELQSTPSRRIKAIITVPTTGSAPFPAVVCIHGHGGNRRIVYDRKNIYKGFADELASSGFITISTDVGQHEVYEKGRTLMGERLWDLIRCVDYLETLDAADKSRIGCGGLSLGGEMAMWLGAMDPRIQATVSSGFLTVMDQLETHCLCWKFPGLRERVDFADIYCLTAPRALQCQNGRKEPPADFTPELAKKAMIEIEVIYRDFGKPGNVELVVHDGAHEIDLTSLTGFFRKHLKTPATRPAGT